MKIFWNAIILDFSGTRWVFMEMLRPVFTPSYNKKKNVILTCTHFIRDTRWVFMKLLRPVFTPFFTPSFKIKKYVIILHDKIQTTNMTISLEWSVVAFSPFPLHPATTTATPFYYVSPTHLLVRCCKVANSWDDDTITGVCTPRPPTRLR